MNLFHNIFVLITIFTISTAVRLRNSATSYCLESDGNEAVSGKVCSQRTNGYQDWIFMDDETVRHGVTGRCLDSNTKENVYVKDCNGGRYQKWTRNPTMQNRQTGKCLDSDGKGKVYTKQCNGGGYQHWT